MNNNQIKLINCFIKYLSKTDEDNYVLRNDELSINEDLLNICIDNNDVLVKNFKLKNWSSLRKAKKRVLQTIIQLLTLFDIELHRKIIYKEGCNNGRRFQSTQGTYNFKWSDENLNLGEYDINDITECVEVISTKEYYKNYYIKNKQHITQIQKDYRENRYMDEILTELD